MEDLAGYFDQWYRDMQDAPVKDEIEQRHLGLPTHLQSTSLLGWEGLGPVHDHGHRHHCHHDGFAGH